MDPEETPSLSILQNFFRDQQLNKYFQSQVSEMTYQQIDKYGDHIAILISFPQKTQQYCHIVDHHKIQFILLIAKSFPRTAPRLFLKSTIGHPSFSDQRDLFGQIYEQWQSKIRLKEIVQRIPQFLKNLIKSEEIRENIKVGRFHLNSVFPIKIMKELWSDNLFYGFEQNQQRLVMYLFTVGETHFCMFLSRQQPHYEEGKLVIPPEKSITECSLVFFAQIGSLRQMTINRDDQTDIKLVFRAKKAIGMQWVDQPCQKKLRVRKGFQMCQKILKNMKNFDVLEMKLDMHMQEMDEEQWEMVKEIQEAENVIVHHLNQKTVQQINNCYQKAIEFYSSRNIPHYEIFLDKITKLYQRPDIRVIMSQTE